MGPPGRRSRHLRGGSPLPGFGLALGFTLLYLGLMVMIPLSTVFLKTATMTWSAFWATVSGPRALAAYRLSLGASSIAAVVNVVFGLLVAWVLERYSFPGRRLIDAFVDLLSPCPRRSPASRSPPSTPGTAGWAAGWSRWE